MSTIPALHSALFGIRENLRVFDETAQRLARTAPGENLAADLVQLKIAEHGVRANVKVAQTAESIADTLLDILG